MNLRVPAQPVIALGLLALAAVLVESVEAWGPDALALEPKKAAFLVVGCLVGAVALANDPAWSFSAAIAAAMFSGHWDSLGSPAPLDRMLFVLGVAAVIVRLPVRWPALGRIRFIHVVLAAAALFAIVSAYVVGTLNDPQGRFALLDRYGVIPFISFALAPVVFDTPQRRAILLGVLTACGAYLGFTALMETLHANAFVWPSYILDITVGIHRNRARGPFVDAGAFGLALWACGVAAAIQAAKPPRPWVRPVAGAIAVLCALGVLFTLTRAIWVGALASGVVTFLFARELRRYIVPATVVGVLLVGGALAAVPNLRHEAHTREQTQSSVWDRRNSNAAAVRMIKARPIAGFGWGRFAVDSPPYYVIAATYPLSSVGEVHNVFLSNGAELGLVGSSLWLLALILAIGVPIFRRPPPDLRLWRVGLLSIAVIWLVTANLSPMASAFPNLLLWTWAGVLWQRREPRRPVALVS